MLKSYLKSIFLECFKEYLLNYFNEQNFYLQQIEQEIEQINKNNDLKQIDIEENTKKLNLMINEVKGIVSQTRACLNIAKEIKNASNKS